jgi:hypothetical protein
MMFVGQEKKMLLTIKLVLFRCSIMYAVASHYDALDRKQTKNIELADK